MLIVDPDLGLLFWLGEIFTKAGCRTIPALDCGQAVSLVTQLRIQLAVVVVNPELVEIGWMIQRYGGPTDSSELSPSLTAIRMSLAGFKLRSR